MIGKLIDWCIRNRAMVLLLCGFLVAAGLWAARNITIDAIPDLSDVQVVIRTDYPGQAPRIIEDQITYPLTTAMLAVPYAKVVRGYSMFGTSFVYIIFEDGTDLYWARSRVLEQLSSIASRLPQGVSPQLGPDATGVGWVYEYMLTTGPYSETHPDGLYRDPTSGKWFASRDDAAPDRREHLVRHRIFPGMTESPLDGSPLVHPQIDLSDLRGLQDWYLRYELTAVDGVSEVAPIGGFVKQYQVVVDPVRLLAYNMPLQKLKMAIQRSNSDVGGRLIEQSENEYMVRGLGYLGTLSPEELEAATRSGKRVEDVQSEKVMEGLRMISLGMNADGSPIYVADVADVRLGPEIRRGIAEVDGEGEVVGGVIVMRFGENAKRTIENAREKLHELEAGLPPGVAIEVAYDRSDLIDRAVETLQHTLIEEILVVGLVCIVFLLHARSALVAAFVLPVGVLVTLTAMYALGINANIMSLGGIAISIGVMVDSSIIMVENAHKFLEADRHRVAQGEAPGFRIQLIGQAAREVGPSLFFALLIIVVSFLPIFVLGEQSGRMFKPLAYTKTFAMTAGAFLSITVIPVLMTLFITERSLPERWSQRKQWLTSLAVIALPALAIAVAPVEGLAVHRLWLAAGWIAFSAMVILPQRIPSEAHNPVSRMLERLYDPAFRFVMRFKALTLLFALLLLGITWYPLSRMGSEFMPPLEEGDLLYMPTTDPGLSITKAREILQQTDKLIKQFPEVKTVFGKIGRAESATDPAPISMIETTITLHRDKTKWRRRSVPRFYDDWPDWLSWLPRTLFPPIRPITQDELIYGYELPTGDGGMLHVPGLNDATQIPGLTNSWTMPIKTRIDMLSTGIKTPVGVKIMGTDLKTLSDIANEVATALKTSPQTSPYTTSAFAEKSVGGNYFDLKINRDEIARYGLTIGDVQDVIMSALGGMNVTATVEGLERYPVNVRYPEELRDDIEAVRRTLVATPYGAQVPLAQLADISIHKGPPMIKSENARLTSWVYVDLAGLDVGTYVDRARDVVAGTVDLPPGYSIVWSGQYEYMQAAARRLSVAIPLALVGIVLLLYISTRSWLRVCIVLLAVPFSLVGAIWFLYFMGYHFSLAVWVGLIALAGLDAETGVVMLLYLDTSYQRFSEEGRMRTAGDLWQAVHDGAVKRIRPKTMTVMAIFMGLMPLLWATGAGADTMRRLAVPMIGGTVSSFALELLIYPVLFYLAKRPGLAAEERITEAAMLKGARA